MKDFITPKDHVSFLAKKLFAEVGEVIDGSIAYLAPGGGGPTELHIHPHNHLFIVVSGQAKIILDREEKIVDENESFIVKGSIPHSVWNNLTDKTTVMVGLSLH